MYALMNFAGGRVTLEYRDMSPSPKTRPGIDFRKCRSCCPSIVGRHLGGRMHALLRYDVGVWWATEGYRL